jgi:large subunit ribosomal protein L9
MKLILIKDVPNLGKKNQVVEVSDGYGKNYLMKNKLATPFTNNSSDKLNEQLKIEEAQIKVEMEKASEIKNKLESISLNFELIQNKGKTSGLISSKEIIEKLKSDHNITIDKNLLSNFHNLGIGAHQVQVDLHKKISAKINVLVKESR